MLQNWLSPYFDLSPASQNKILGTLAIILLVVALRWIIVNLVLSRVEDLRTRYNWQKTTTYLVVILGILLAGPLWLSGIQSLVTFLGLVSAGLAIALQGPLTDLAGWIFILLRRPFEIGDRIQIGEHAGDVVDMRLFQFTLLEIGNWVHADQSTGRILHVPNKKIFEDAVANYTVGFEYIWHEIPVLVTFESNWEKAKSILQEIANQEVAHLSADAAERIKTAARRFFIFYHNLTPIVYGCVIHIYD